MKSIEILTIVNEFKETGNYSLIEKLENNLKEDIRKELVKKTGNVKIDAVLKRMHQSLNSKKLYRPELQGYSKVGKRFLFTDSYRMIVLNSDYGYKPMELKTDFSKFTILGSDYKEVTVDIEELAYHVKLCKALTKENPHKKTGYYEIPNTNTCINGYWLLEMLKALKTDTIQILSPIAPVYIGNTSNEFGMILPMRKTV